MTNDSVRSASALAGAGTRNSRRFAAAGDKGASSARLTPAPPDDDDEGGDFCVDWCAANGSASSSRDELMLRAAAGDDASFENTASNEEAVTGCGGVHGKEGAVCRAGGAGAALVCATEPRVSRENEPPVAVLAW